jgi:hypothetical protein
MYLLLFNVNEKLPNLTLYPRLELGYSNVYYAIFFSANRQPHRPI